MCSYLDPKITKIKANWILSYPPYCLGQVCSGSFNEFKFHFKFTHNKKNLVKSWQCVQYNIKEKLTSFIWRVFFVCEFQKIVKFVKTTTYTVLPSSKKFCKTTGHVFILSCSAQIILSQERQTFLFKVGETQQIPSRSGRGWENKVREIVSIEI